MQNVLKSVIIFIIKTIFTVLISLFLIAVIGIPIEIISLVISVAGVFVWSKIFNGGNNMNSKTLYRMRLIGTFEVSL